MYDHILNQTITITNPSGTNDYGEPTGGSPFTAKARVDLVNKTKTNAAGESVQIAAKVLVSPSITVDAGAKVAYDGVNYKVVAKISTPGANGVVQAVSLECSEWR